MNTAKLSIKRLLAWLVFLAGMQFHHLNAQAFRAFEMQFKARNYGIDMGLNIQRNWRNRMVPIGLKIHDVLQTATADTQTFLLNRGVERASPDKIELMQTRHLGGEIHGAWIERTSFFYSLEFGNIKDPREQLVVNERLIGSRPFKLNKISHTWMLKPSIGKIWSVSERRSRNDVGFRMVGNLGVPVAYSWPIYIWLYQRNFLIDGYVDAKYDPAVQPSTEIGGTASWTKGIKQGKFTPGVSGSMGFQFEWGSYKQVTNSITMGCSVDYFVQKIPNWYNPNMNRNIFPAVFVTFAAGISRDE